MEILTANWHGGPSIWLRSPVCAVKVGTSDSVELTTNTLTNIDNRLAQWLTAALEPDTPITPLPLIAMADVTQRPLLFARLALNLQRLAGIDCRFADAVSESGADIYHVVFESPHPRIADESSDLAIRILQSIGPTGESDFDFKREFARRYWVQVSQHDFRGTSLSIATTARRRGIPVDYLISHAQLVELGNGAYRQRLTGGRTSHTTETARRISEDKQVTREYLVAAGLPAPAGNIARSAKQAVAIADRIGYPVVVKPASSGASIGIYLDVKNAREVQEKYDLASVDGGTERIVVERQHSGETFRASVVNGEIISVTARIPASVKGNGADSIRQLIHALNLDPRRGRKQTHSLSPIDLDERTVAELSKQGMTFDSVPVLNEHVRIKPFGTGPGGGFLGAYSIDFTQNIHPENAELIRQAVRTVGLDICTLDLVSPDISVPLRENGGVIIEINSDSGFTNELDPALGISYDVGPAIVDMLFPPGQPVRAPIIAIMGDKVQGHAIATALTAMLQAAGYAVGLAAHDGLTLVGTFLRGVEHRGPAGVRTLLNNPATEIVVAEIDADELIAEGLGFDYCDVAIVTGLCGQLTPFDEPVEAVLTGLLEPTGTVIVASHVPLDDLVPSDAESPVVVPIDSNATEAVASIVEAVMSSVGSPPGPQPSS